MVRTVVLHNDLATYIDQIPSGNELSCRTVNVDVRLEIDVACPPQHVAHHGFPRALRSWIDVLDDLAHKPDAMAAAQAVGPVAQELLGDQTPPDEVVSHGYQFCLVQMGSQIDDDPDG